MAKSTKLTQLGHSANDYSITLSARAPLRMVFKELRRHDPARPEGHEESMATISTEEEFWESAGTKIIVATRR